MGWLKSITKVARGAVSPVLSGARAINKIPGAGVALKAVPVVGNALALAGAASAVSSAFGGKSSGLPAMPGGLPALPGASAGGLATMGNRGIFRNDANVADWMKPFTISKGDLRVQYRAPKGFVVLRDSVGDPYAVPKQVARMLGWKPASKPPISVGDWNAVKKADRTVKKMRKIFAVTTRVDKQVTHGKVVVHRKKKGK